MTYQSVNPFNGEILKTYETVGDESLEAKIAAAAECYPSWRRHSYAERAALVRKAAALMREREDDLARGMTLEMGNGSARRRPRFNSAPTFSTITPRTPNAS